MSRNSPLSERPRRKSPAPPPPPRDSRGGAYPYAVLFIVVRAAAFSIEITNIITQFLHPGLRNVRRNKNSTIGSKTRKELQLVDVRARSLSHTLQVIGVHSRSAAWEPVVPSFPHCSISPFLLRHLFIYFRSFLFCVLCLFLFFFCARTLSNPRRRNAICYSRLITDRRLIGAAFASPLV